MDELNRMGCADHQIVISTNVETRRDGLPYSGRREPDDTGVAVYFERDGREQCIPCDRWDRVRDNLQAIHKTINALRGLERWGAQNTVDAAFRGFNALPEPDSGDNDHWSSVFGVPRDAPMTVVAIAYKKLRSVSHPDTGGNRQAFNRVQDAWGNFLRERGL